MNLAGKHHSRVLARRYWDGWRSMIQTKWQDRVSKACQAKAEEVCQTLTDDYETQIKSVSRHRRCGSCFVLADTISSTVHSKCSLIQKNVLHWLIPSICGTCEFHEPKLLLVLICIIVFYSLYGTTVAVFPPRFMMKTCPQWHAVLSLSWHFVNWCQPSPNQLVVGRTVALKSCYVMCTVPGIKITCFWQWVRALVWIII